MIPEFPHFKRIELSDKKEVEEITRRYPPYSDFNFVSMWSWDIKGEMRLSMLNGNLVVKFNDYLTGQPFYSFLGDNKTDETAETLLELSKKENLKQELKLVPEESIRKLSGKFKILEDEDHFDYILDLHDLANYKGKDLSSHRHHANQFKKNFNYKTIIIDGKDEYNWNEIFSFLDYLDSRDTSADIKNEISAVKKFGLTPELHNKILVIKICVEEKPIAITICELINDTYVMGHFLKADKIFSKAVMSHIIKETALAFSEVKFINIQQDLGKPGLRSWKKGFRPVSYLKKYIIKV